MSNDITIQQTIFFMGSINIINKYVKRYQRLG